MGDNLKKAILLVRSTGFPQEWVAEMLNTFAKVHFEVADDNESSIHSSVSGVNAMIGCPRPLFTEALLQKAGPSLTWVHVGGAGVEEFLTPQFVRNDVTLTNGKIIQGPEVSDHAIALLLALTRNIHYLLSGKGPRPMPRPIELRKKTALVFGVGGIGSLTAEKLKAFGMYVMGVDPRYLPMTCSIDEMHLSEDLLDLLPRADVVICCCPSTDRSRYVFNENAFRMMKKEAFFINVSRGKLVMTEDLAKVLKEGHLRGVGLDVTDPEPLSEDHPLIRMDNVLITPHFAGPSDHNRRRSFELIRHNIQRFINDAELINVVDKKLGY